MILKFVEICEFAFAAGRPAFISWFSGSNYVSSKAAQLMGPHCRVVGPTGCSCRSLCHAALTFAGVKVKGADKMLVENAKHVAPANAKPQADAGEQGRDGNWRHAREG